MKRVVHLVFALVLAGCSSLGTGEMSRKYTEAARALGLNPVYPPREEFQIGDVYLVSSVPDDPDGAVSVWIGTVDELRDEANAFLKTRVIFNSTGAGTDGKTIGITQEDMASPDVAIRDEQRATSLTIAAFPSITMQAGMTASTGLTGAMAAFGFGTSEQTTVTLDFNDVRTYGVPKVLVAQTYQSAAVQRFGGERFDLGALELPEKIKAKEILSGRKWHGDRCLSMVIVTRVFLTRQINYTYRDRSIVAAGLKVASKEGELSKVSAAPSITVNVLANSDDPTKNGETAAAMAEAMRIAVASVSSGASAEGGSFSFVSWDARGLTFKQIFQRPVAIGWEGFTLAAQPVDIPGHKLCRD